MSDRVWGGGGCLLELPVEGGAPLYEDEGGERDGSDTDTTSSDEDTRRAASMRKAMRITPLHRPQHGLR